MKNLLIKASIDYADEFDCEVFAVMTEEKWDSFCNKIKKLFTKADGEISIGFGTNEGLEFSNYENWFEEFETIEITKEQSKFLQKNFGKEWGTGSNVFDADCYSEGSYY